MALHLKYITTTFRPGDDILPGNSTAAAPLEFDLAPAEGPDLARLKSIIVGTGGLTGDIPWTEAAQGIVVSSIVHGRDAYVNTVTAIRGLTVPAALALRAGLVDTEGVPKKIHRAGEDPRPDLEAPIAVRTGYAFAKVCGFMPGIAMTVAGKIAELTNAQAIDPRFFAPGFGSGEAATPAPKPTTAEPAQPPPDGPATAADETTPAT